MTDESGARREQLDAQDSGLAGSMAVMLRRWRLIAGGAVAAGLVAFLLVQLATARRWQSVATLVIAPLAFASELKPRTLSVQGYQKLLESGAVIAEARRHLVESGSLSGADVLRLGQELETRIFVSRRAEETSLSPMVLAVAYGRSPEQAAAIANAWAASFLQAVRDLAAAATSPTVDSVGIQYAQVGQALTELEQRQGAAARTAAERRGAAADRWQREIVEKQAGALADVAAYNAETARQVAALAAKLAVETRRARLAARREALADLEHERGRSEAQRAGKRAELETARALLAQTPALIEVRKALSDDAALLAATAADGGKTRWDVVSARALVSQEINPVHTELAASLARLEIEVNALAPRAEQLAALVGERLAELREEEAALADADAAAATLREQRTAGLLALQKRQEAAIAALERARERELAAFDGENEIAKAAFDRDITAHRELLASLSRVHNQAALAKMQPDMQDVRLAVPAVAPQAPEPRGTLVKTALAALLGGLLALLLALAMEAQQAASR